MAFLGEGFGDLNRRLRLAWAWVQRLRIRRALASAEAELGWLGWEQVDFFDETIAAEVEKIREFENTQAELYNATAELGGRKVDLDAELATGKGKHEAVLEELAAERSPVAADLQKAETARKQKLEAVDRFQKAIDEIQRTEARLEHESHSYLGIEKPSIQIRTQAREVSDELLRIANERKLVQADQLRSVQEASLLEPAIAGFRAELQRIDAAIAAARDEFAATTRRINGEIRALERQRRKSDMHMSHLDRKKRKPYRFIGACLADHGISPLNQPQILEKVLALRTQESVIAESMATLRAECAAANANTLTIFYLILALLCLTLLSLALHHP